MPPSSFSSQISSSFREHGCTRSARLGRRREFEIEEAFLVVFDDHLLFIVSDFKSPGYGPQVLFERCQPGVHRSETGIHFPIQPTDVCLVRLRPKTPVHVTFELLDGHWLSRNAHHIIVPLALTMP